MAYGDYSGPDKANKGHEGGACNRQRCQAEPAIWYNHGSRSWYCVDCRADIEFDPVNSRDWQANWAPKLGHPMFETRALMEGRVQKRRCPDCLYHQWGGNVSICRLGYPPHGILTFTKRGPREDCGPEGKLFEPVSTPPRITKEGECG